MMRSFLCGSLLLACIAIGGCGRLPYWNDNLHPENRPVQRVYTPVYDRVLYRAIIDGRVLFKKFHLSGNLLVKKTEDGSTHAVFQNELGFTFFHFTWSPVESDTIDDWFSGRMISFTGDSFQVLSVVPQLNRPTVIKTLQKDLAMLLLRQSHYGNELNGYAERVVYSYCRPVKGSVFYIGSKTDLLRIEDWGRRKKVTTIGFKAMPYPAPLPDSVLIRHHRANFKIQLVRSADPADE